MRRPLRHVLGISAVLLLAAGLVVQGCQQDVGMTTGPDVTAAVVMRTLKVSGGGHGNGHVTAPPTAGTAALDCPIVAATWDPVACTKAYPQGTVVQLTAVPDPGFTFKEWTGPCTGTNPTCNLTMSITRNVKAHFKGPTVPRFQVNVSGAGTGGGTVTSQPTLAPNIACTLNAGTPTGTCSRPYPSGTNLILTASPTSGHTFDGWSGDCTGTGTCNLSVTTNRSATANFSAAEGPEATFGKWASSQSTLVIGLHLNLLPSGSALMWGHGGEPQLMNLGGGGFTQVSNQTCTNPATCELFCSGHTFLADGRLLVAGGHNEASGDGFGLSQASTFNGSSWQATGSMTYARWYPTLVTLENGDVVALSGSRTPSLNASIPERFNGSTWTPLITANQSLPLYPTAFVEPKNGHVFVAGEGTVRILNPAGTGSWSTGPARIVSNRSYGSVVMLDSKVLYAGGGGSGCPGTPQASAEIIDLAAPSPTWAATGSMANARRQTNLTILPDGKVLMTGGSSQCGFTNETGAVFAAEMWNPGGDKRGMDRPSPPRTSSGCITRPPPCFPMAACCPPGVETAAE